MNLAPVPGPTASSSTSSSNITVFQRLHCWSFLSHDLSSSYFPSTCPIIYLNQKVLQIPRKSYLCSGYFLTKVSANDLGTERSPWCKRRGIGHLSSSPLHPLPCSSLGNSAHLVARGPGHHCPNLSQTGISDLACTRCASCC